MTHLMEQEYSASPVLQAAHPVARGAAHVPAQADQPETRSWNKWEKPKGLPDFITRLLITPPQWVLWIVRALPAPKLFWRFVGRYDEVIEVLSRPDVFQVPAAAEIARLNDGEGTGTAFILGYDDQMQHDEQLTRVMRAFPRKDIATKVLPLAAKCAAQCVHDAGPTFDAVRDLFTKVALHICVEYFGVSVGDNPLKFAYATFTTSGHLFGSPPIIPNDYANEATAYFRRYVREAIRGEEAQPSGSGSDTVVAKFVASHRSADGTLSDKDFKQIHAFLMGMIVAFIPNNTLAAGHILEVLLDKPVALAEAEKAANTGDDARLECVLFEALRFMPINPGPFRKCEKDYVLAEGTPRATRIKAGSTVWVLTFASMFDPLRIAEPKKFDWTRPKSDHLHFGFGMHSCAGLLIARAHITQTFKALLQKRCELKRASRTRLRGAMPVELCISSKARLSTVGLDEASRGNVS